MVAWLLPLVPAAAGECQFHSPVWGPLKGQIDRESVKVRGPMWRGCAHARMHACTCSVAALLQQAAGTRRSGMRACLPSSCGGDKELLWEC